MVKFSFENLNLVEMVDYITKLLNDVKENEKNLNNCKNYIYGLVVIDTNMSDEEKRLQNIKVFFQDKLNKTNLLKYSRKQKQLKKKLQDLEIYLINKGIIKLEPEEPEENILLTDEEEEDYKSISSYNL